MYICHPSLSDTFVTVYETFDESILLCSEGNVSDYLLSPVSSSVHQRVSDPSIVIFLFYLEVETPFLTVTNPSTE